VEIEQIVEDERIQSPGRISVSSYVHVRGSIPVLWKQGSAAKPKPEIILNNEDYMLTLTKMHIADLIKRYGTPITFINLTKLNSKREERLSMVFRKSLKHITDLIMANNQGVKYVQYRHADLSKIIRATKKIKPETNEYSGDARNFEELLDMIKKLEEEIGIFLCRDIKNNYPESDIFFQKGVLRSNCIDCLDRTNNFQVIVGRKILIKQVLFSNVV
jgi:hypothetical protein